MGNEQKLSLKTILLPLLMAFGSDFLFFWVINVAFLTQIKGLSYEAFFQTEIIAALISIIFAYPTLWLVSKIGNNISYKIGASCLFVSAILFTFGTKFITFAVANTLYYLMFNFNIVTPVIFENNLKKAGREDLFLKYTATGRALFSVFTLIAVMFAGILYELDAYIPMYLCILMSAINLVLSFFIKDETRSKYDISKICGKNKVQMSKNMLFFSVLFVLFLIIIRGCVCIGEQYSKVALQEINASVLTISVVLFIGSLFRVILNFFSERIINRFSKNLSAILFCILIVALLLMSFPILLINDFNLQLVLISVGVLLVTIMLDIYKVYINYLIINCYEQVYHLKMLWYNEVFGSIGILLSSSLVTVIIMQSNVAYGLFALAGFSLIGWGISIIMIKKYLNLFNFFIKR